MLWCQKLGSVPKHIENWDMSFRKNRISWGYFEATQ